MQRATAQLLMRARRAARTEHVLGRAGELDDTRELRPSRREGGAWAVNAVATCPGTSGEPEEH